jgi:hypothetical protein
MHLPKEKPKRKLFKKNLNTKKQKIAIADAKTQNRALNMSETDNHPICMNTTS